MKTISELSKEVEAMIERVKNGQATQYTSYFCEESDTTWKIRVSNHKANPERADNNTISFVVPVEVEEDEDSPYSPFHTNKKKFISLPNQYVIVNGCDENGYSIEDLLTYKMQ